MSIPSLLTVKPLINTLSGNEPHERRIQVEKIIGNWKPDRTDVCGHDKIKFLEYLLKNCCGFRKAEPIASIINKNFPNGNYTKSSFQHRIIVPLRKAGDLFIGWCRKGIYLIEKWEDAQQTIKYYESRIQSETNHLENVKQLVSKHKLSKLVAPLFSIFIVPFISFQLHSSVNNDLSDASVFPNPIIRSEGMMAVFNNIPPHCAISIYNRSGSLQRALDSVDDPFVAWDLRDSVGSLVPDDVYRVVFTANIGTKETFLFLNVGSIGGSVTMSFVGVSPGSYQTIAMDAQAVPIGTVTLVVPSSPDPDNGSRHHSWFPGCSRRLRD